MITLNLCSGNGMSASFRELMPQFERANNCKVAMHFEPGQILLREIKAGKNFDLGFMGEAAMNLETAVDPMCNASMLANAAVRAS